MRIPIALVAVDGTATDGTAAVVSHEDGSYEVQDFRDLSGEPLSLPPGARFEVPYPGIFQ